MSEDFSDILNKFSNILKEKDIDLNKIVGGNTPSTNFNNCKKDNINENNNNIDFSCENNGFNDSSTDCEENSFNDFNLDLETILKIKSILSSINKNNHCPRNNLLMALKPYLKNNKKEKLEQYIKIANLLTVLENFDSNMKPKFTESNYDFVLILTLFLLLF